MLPPRLRIRLPLVAALLVAPLQAGAVDIPVPGRTGLTRLDKNTGLGKVTKMVARAAKGTTFAIPAPGGPDDPRVVGGTFRRCKFPEALGWATIDLPAANWKGLGNPAGSRGWRYRGAGTAGDPCRRVIVKPKVVRAVCKGPTSNDSQFTLPVSPDSVGDELVLGSTRYCTRFDPVHFVRDDQVRRIWKARKAPAPASCPNLDPPTPTPGPSPSPTPPAYGSASLAFIERSTSLLE